MAALDLVAGWPATAAVAVTDSGRTLASTGPADAFAWASVTKLRVWPELSDAVLAEFAG
jgi:hypothetical protein